MTEMAELARAVASAAATAAEAARAVSQVSNSGDKKKDLHRLIPRPATFAPADRDQEVSQWRDWYWSLRQYLLVVDSKYEDDLNYVERSDVDEVDWDLLDADEQYRGRFMYSLLSTLLQGRLLSLIRSVENSNGLEALRQLLQNCQPRARNRTMAMLQSLMAYPAFNMKSSIMAQVVRLEESFQQFEKMGGKMTEEMKSAVLLKCISGPLKVHLNLALNESSSYNKIREVVRAYDTATTKWSEVPTAFPLQPQGDPTGLAPMEIDRVKGGKPGLKGKSKGKDGKGKTKGKDLKGKGKGQNLHGQWNPTASSSSWTSTSKGSGKGDQKPQMDKSKGKSKGKDSGLCFNCGRPGHHAKDCWRVRQVGNAEVSATVLTNATGQESVGPSASQSGSLAVKRVMMSTAGESVEAPVVFDLRSSESSSSWQHVRMVKFYYIDEELDESSSIRSTTFMEDENIKCYDLDKDEVNIIIDSGADAPVFPASMIHCGRDHKGQSVALQDAQGRQIPVLGQKAVSVLLQDASGVEIELQDNVVFSNEITQPILSYGRLMNAGWSICAESRCLKNGNYKIPLEFQNHSLVVKGHVRAIATVPFSVRTLKVELLPGFREYVEGAFGWNKEGPGNIWIGIHLSVQYQNPLFVPNIDYTIDWFRTTLIKKGQEWIMVEYCERVSEMMDPERYIDETAGRTTVVTFLTDGYVDVDTMGFVAEGAIEREEWEALEQQIQPLLDIPED